MDTGLDHKKLEVLERAKATGTDFVHLQFTDLMGIVKAVTIPVERLENALANGVWFDGSSIEGFARIAESDMYLVPDADTFSPVPWSQAEGTKTARIICDVYSPNGEPFRGDPRGTLKRILAKVEEKGFVFNTGPELEFFLFPLDSHGHVVLEQHDHGGYFDLSTDQAIHVRKDMVNALQAFGIEVEASHHEVAIGQHEIDFRYGNALASADYAMTFKYALKSVAKKNGLHATFMPKPIFGVNGSGMHTNMSLFKDGVNVFHDPADPRGLSREAYGFIAGLLAHVKGMAAITNPLVNSYKRLVPGYEAPCYLSWSASNRSALIRIPAARGQSTRVELRCPDPSCNPYLALAVCLAAGLDGIEQGMTPPPEVTENIFEMCSDERCEKGIDSLPGSLKEAIEALKQDQLILDTLGEHTSTQYIAGKEAEWDAYRTRVTNWEIEKYIVTY